MVLDMKLLILFGLILVGCSKSDDFSEQPPAIEPLGIVRSVPGYDFFWPQSIAADSGLVFIADFRDCIIRVFDNELNYLYSIGREGQGPGEFESLIDIDVRHGILVAVNLTPPRISFFDYQGNHLQELPIKAARWSDITITQQHTLLLAKFNRSSSNIVTELSFDGEIINQYLPTPELASYGMSYGIRVRLRSGPESSFALFEQEPRVFGVGMSDRDHLYPLENAFEWMNQFLKIRKKWRNEGKTAFMPVGMFGGFDIFQNYLIIAGPAFNLLVLDLSSGKMHVIQMGSFAAELRTEHGLTEQQRGSSSPKGALGIQSTKSNTYCDARIVGEEIWFLSSLNSCLVKFSLTDILTAAVNGQILEPDDFRRGVY